MGVLPSTILVLLMLLLLLLWLNECPLVWSAVLWLPPLLTGACFFAQILCTTAATIYNRTHIHSNTHSHGTLIFTDSFGGVSSVLIDHTQLATAISEKGRRIMLALSCHWLVNVCFRLPVHSFKELGACQLHLFSNSLLNSLLCLTILLPIKYNPTNQLYEFECINSWSC